MLDKKRGYAYDRPFYTVDENVNIQAGMVAFLATNAAGAVIATTAASGSVPIGTFWKDSAVSFVRSTVEVQSFNANGILTVQHANIVSSALGVVTNVAGTVTYVDGVDYSVSLTNGVLTRIPGGAIPALATVIVRYRYTVPSGQEHWEHGSTQWSTGFNYDRQANDTLGSGKITVAEGDAQLYTDQYVVTDTFTLNAQVKSSAGSLWTLNASAGVGSACGRVVKIPSAADPFLGVAQIRVVA